MSGDDDLSYLLLFELYCEEMCMQIQVLLEWLFVFELGEFDFVVLEVCMCVVYLLKGVVWIVGVLFGVDIVGWMEECFVVVQVGMIVLMVMYVDVLLVGVDLLVCVGDL